MMSRHNGQENLRRVGFLAAVPHVLRRFGVDPVDLLVSVGLSATALDDPNATIPLTAAGRLLFLSAEQTGCSHFGLEVAQSIRTASLGPAGELMRNAPTLGVALQDFVSHQHLHVQGAPAYLLVIEDRAFFGYAIYQPELDGYRQVCDAAALMAFNLVREMVAQGTAPILEVMFARTQPSFMTPYESAFGVNLRFNQNQTAVVLPRKLLDRPIPEADAARRENLKERVTDLWQAGEPDTVTQLRRLLRIALLSGQTAVDDVSSQMGMSRRTLHRRLSDTGLRFRNVLDDTRCEFAKQLLCNTSLSAEKIGSTLGYSDPSAFTRMFSRMTGSPPGKWRIDARRSRASGFGNGYRAASA
jgi:AraC-like DNA-binding protein